jgi:glycosyltransferase involved in cell wall biosynthesis
MRVENDRVLFVLTALGVGGAEVQVLTIMQAMRELGWRPALVALAGGPLEERIRAAGFPLRILSGTPGVHDPRLLFELVAAFREFHPAVVHSHTAPANLLCRAARLFHWVPRLISTAHNVHEGRYRHLYYRATDRLASVTTNVSRAAAQRYVEIGATPRERMLCTPNAIDTTVFRREAAWRGARRAELDAGSSFVWLAVGRFQAQKAYPRMLEAFEVHLRTYPEDRLLLVGTGELHDAIATEAQRPRLGGRVQLLGRRLDVVELMSAADGYLMSSDWEGLPIVLLEAAACELPAVVTDVGGNAEVVLDAETGFVVEPQRPDLLAAAMARLRGLPDTERAALGAAARRHVVNNYSIRAMAERWDAIYRGEIPADAVLSDTAARGAALRRRT